MTTVTIKTTFERKNGSKIVFKAISQQQGSEGILIFVRGARTASIAVRSATLGGSAVTILVLPRDATPR